MTRTANPKVAATFKTFPLAARVRLAALRDMIFDVAAKNGCVLEESLKWGEPAYRAGGGSMVRLGWKARAPDEVAMYFICTTGLVDRFRELYPRDFRFGGNRALLFGLTGSLPQKALRHCIALALTHRRK